MARKTGKKRKQTGKGCKRKQTGGAWGSRDGSWAKWLGFGKGRKTRITKKQKGGRKRRKQRGRGSVADWITKAGGVL